MQRLVTQPVHVTVSGRRAISHGPLGRAEHRRVTAHRLQQETWLPRAAKVALGVVLAAAILGLLGTIDNVVSASADGSHHPVSQRAALSSVR
jgi:hypothetical protein